MKYFFIIFLLTKKCKEEYLKNYDSDELNLTDSDKRKRAIKMLKSKKLIRELLFNFVFLFILFVVSYTNKDLNSFAYKNSLETLILTDFDQIENVNDVWYWINYLLMPKLFIDYSNYIQDGSSIILNYPILRQLRVKKSN